MSFYKEVFFATLISGLLLLIITFPARITPLNIYDDPLYLKISNPELSYFKEFEDPEIYSSFSKFFSRYNLNDGRFIPLSIGVLWLIAKVTSANPLAIQAILFSFSMLCGMLFFVLLRKLKIAFHLSVLFTCLFFSGHYDTMWYRRSGETFALLFLFLSFLFFIKHFETRKILFAFLSITSMICSVLFKESFIPLLPMVGLAMIIYTINERSDSFLQSFKTTMPFQLAWICLLLLFIIIYLTNHSLHNYTEFSNSSQFLLHNLIVMCGSWYTVIPVITYAFYLLFLKQFKFIHLLFLALLTGWIGTQILVYYGIEIPTYSRYQMPALLLPLILCALCTEEFRRRNFILLSHAFLTILTLIIIINSKNIFQNAGFYKARAEAFHKMIGSIGNDIRTEHENLIVFTEHGEGFTSAVPLYLSKNNIEISKDNIRFIDFQISTKNKSFLNLCMDSSVYWIINSVPVENYSKVKQEYTCASRKEKVFTEKWFSASWREIATLPYEAWFSEISYVCYK